jgi:hypothetical protein
MRQQTHDPGIDGLNIDGLKNEMQSLRETVAALSAEVTTLRLAATPPRRRKLSGIVLRRWPLAAAIPILAIAALAQSGDVALVVDAANGNVRMANSLTVAKGLTVSGNAKMNDSLDVTKALTVNGNLGIGAPSSGARLDVSGSAAKNTQAVLARGADANFQLTVQNGDGKNTPLAELARLGIQYLGTGWNSGIRFFRGVGAIDGALAVDTNGKERVRVASNGNVGIGKENPDSTLDVKGEVRGKLWTSGVYSWTQGQAKQKMTRADRSVCFLTLVSGKFMGKGEAVGIVSVDNYWYLTGESAQYDVRAQARCIGTPDESAW